MNACRKTHRKSTDSDLIGKVGGKLEDKVPQETGGDYILFVEGHI